MSWLQKWQIRLEIRKIFEDERSSNGRLQNLGWVLQMPRKLFSQDNINVANHTLGEKGCTKWPLKFPFISTVLLVWLPTLMFFGLSPVPNCFWVETLDLFSNKSTSDSGPQFNKKSILESSLKFYGNKTTSKTKKIVGLLNSGVNQRNTETWSP